METRPAQSRLLLRLALAIDDSKIPLSPPGRRCLETPPKPHRDSQGEVTDEVFTDEVRDWGIPALHRCIEGLACVTAVHICYGYGIAANRDWKASLGGEWRQYEAIFPALAASHIQQVSIECRNSRVPISLLGLLEDKDVLLGVIDVATDRIETAEDVVATIEQAMRYVSAERIFPCTNCGMAPLHRDIALAKLAALGRGAALARDKLG